MLELKHPRNFTDRNEYVRYLSDIFSVEAKANDSVSYIQGGHAMAKRKLKNIKPESYCRNRNYINGDVTKLSPYIRHGVLSSLEIIRSAKNIQPDLHKIEKFIQEVSWRGFWQHIYSTKPEWIWEDIEPYKTGFSASDYATTLPDDIRNASTGVAVIDAFLEELMHTGYIHNHGRMYVASYMCHFRRIKWQCGARFFLEHLLDGDPASNNLSFQWVASTFSHKPYIFNLENAQKYCGDYCDTTAENNHILNASYEELSKQLFPNKEAL